MIFLSGNEEGAFKLAEELEPVKPVEFLVKAIAYAMMGVKADSVSFSPPFKLKDPNF